MAQIIFDLDGVLIRSRNPDGSFIWQNEIMADLGLSKETIREIFEPTEWNKILCGKQSFEKRLKHIFESIGSSINAENFFEYWLSKDLNWYPELLKLAKYLRDQGHNIYIGTNQDVVRSNFIRRQSEVTPLFEKVISSCDIGEAKPSPAFYIRLRSILKIDSSSLIIVIDDSTKNLKSAEERGLTSIHFNPDFEGSHNCQYLLATLQEKL